MKKDVKKYGLIILILIILIVISWFVMIDLFMMSIFGSKKSTKYIEKQFQESIEIFTNSLNELQKKENHIHFLTDSGDILITEYINNGNSTEMVYLNDDNIIGYDSTLELIKNKKIEVIVSEDGNVSYMFNSAIGLAQYIAYIDDMQAYTYGYSIKLLKNIHGKWYYVETN